MKRCGQSLGPYHAMFSSLTQGSRDARSSLQGKDGHQAPSDAFSFSTGGALIKRSIATQAARNGKPVPDDVAMTNNVYGGSFALSATAMTVVVYR